MKQLILWFKEHTGLLVGITSLLSIIVAIESYLLFSVSEEARSSSTIPSSTNPSSIYFDDNKIIDLDSSRIQDLQSFSDESRDSLVLELNQSDFVNLSSALRNRYPKGECFDTKPTGAGQFVKISVALFGKGINLKNFVINDKDYAAKCFTLKKDTLLMKKYIRLDSGNVINFLSRFNSVSTVNLPYKFSVKLLDDKGSILTKFPVDKAFQEGIISALSTTISIEDKLTIPSSLTAPITAMAR